VAGYLSEDSVDAVGAVGSASDGQLRMNDVQQDMASESLRWKSALEDSHAAHTYSCYMLVIQVLNHLSLDKIDTQVIAESQLMDVEHEIQSKLIDISKSVSAIQGQVQSYVPYSVTHSAGTDSWSPDSFLGLNSNFYNIGETMQDWGTEHVSSDFQSDVDTLEGAIKQLFYANSDATAPTVGDLSKISNPNVFQGGQDFDLTNLWSKLQQESSKYNKSYSTDMLGNSYSSPKTFNVISTNTSDHASLIQQYLFYKAQLAVDGGSIQTVNAAQGDITKLVDFTFDGSGDDGFLNQIMSLLTTLDGKVSVSRVQDLDPWMDTTSDSVLDLLLQDQRYNYVVNGSSPSGWWDSDAGKWINNEGSWHNDGSGNPANLGDDPRVGIYGAFSFMGFNNFWTKATSTTDEQHIPSDNVPYIGTAPDHSHPVNDTGAWDAPEASYRNGFFGENAVKGVGGNDMLTAATTGLNNSVTNIGSAAGTESTKMQELTSNEGENVNIGQSAIKSLDNAIQTFDTNQLDN